MPPLVSRRIPLVALALTAAACADPSAPATPGAETPAPLARTAGPADAATQPIPDQYIVVFRDGVADVPGLARRLGGAGLRHTYRHAVRGFSARMSAPAAAALARNPNVAVVEQDQVMTVVATTQNNATWGLDRIDQRALPLSTTYTYASDGVGVHAYIVDTGIRLTHAEFTGRLSAGFDAITSGGSGADCNGHGTHVAGTVGGTTYGVAKRVTLHPVRVLDCNGSGTTSGVIAGVDWVTANHVKPAVANMSLGGGASSTLDAAVRNSIAAGVSYAVAAGNGDRFGRQQDACNYSPARVAEAITIGAADKTDKKASWSNYGNCVDFFAPGVSITSAWYQNDTQTNTISGTSMAAPHVAGAAALYLQANPGASPQAVRDALYAATTKGIVTSSSTANNHLLHVDPGAVAPPPDNAAPTAAFTYACTELACSFTDGSSDTDGTIASRSWTFGDGTASTATNPSHTYAASGTYTVTLTATDDDGATGTTSRSVTVSTAPTGDITLSASGYKVQGRQRADLAWSGATSTSIDVYRNGSRVATTANDGAYTDNIGARGGGSYTYRVCAAGTSTCSATVTVTF